jgi:hypothetical protein
MPCGKNYDVQGQEALGVCLCAFVSSWLNCWDGSAKLLGWLCQAAEMALPNCWDGSSELPEMALLNCLGWLCRTAWNGSAELPGMALPNCWDGSAELPAMNRIGLVLFDRNNRIFRP